MIASIVDIFLNIYLTHSTTGPTLIKVLRLIRILRVLKLAKSMEGL